MAPPASCSLTGTFHQRQGAIWQANTSPAVNCNHTLPEMGLCSPAGCWWPLALGRQPATLKQVHTSAGSPFLPSCCVSLVRLRTAHPQAPHLLLLEPPLG